MLRRSNGSAAMVARWDALLLAATVLGGSMAIENSHRVDTGAPDEDLTAAPACIDAQIAPRSGLRRDLGIDDGTSPGTDEDGARALAPDSCARE